MELQIINKNHVPKLLTATKFAVPLIKSNILFEAFPEIVSTEKLVGK